MGSSNPSPALQHHGPVCCYSTSMPSSPIQALHVAGGGARQAVPEPYGHHSFCFCPCWHELQRKVSGRCRTKVRRRQAARPFSSAKPPAP